MMQTLSDECQIDKRFLLVLYPIIILFLFFLVSSVFLSFLFLLLTFLGYTSFFSPFSSFPCASLFTLVFFFFLLFAINFPSVYLPALFLLCLCRSAFHSLRFVLFSSLPIFFFPSASSFYSFTLYLVSFLVSFLFFPFFLLSRFPLSFCLFSPFLPSFLMSPLFPVSFSHGFFASFPIFPSTSSTMFLLPPPLSFCLLLPSSLSLLLHLFHFLFLFPYPPPPPFFLFTPHFSNLSMFLTLMFTVLITSKVLFISKHKQKKKINK